METTKRNVSTAETLSNDATANSDQLAFLQMIENLTAAIYAILARVEVLENVALQTTVKTHDQTTENTGAAE